MLVPKAPTERARFAFRHKQMMPLVPRGRYGRRHAGGALQPCSRIVASTSLLGDGQSFPVKYQPIGPARLAHDLYVAHRDESILAYAFLAGHHVASYEQGLAREGPL